MKLDILLHRRGPALWPEVFPLPLLKSRLRELGTALFHTVYQGEPAPAEGLVFRAEWFRSYATHPKLVETGQAWDTAMKGGQEHDYSCGVTGGRDADGNIYLLDVWRGQVDTPELVRVVKAQAARWRPRWVLIEDASSGPAIRALLRAGGMLPIIPVRADKDKRRRALAITPAVEGGNVRLPEHAPWLEAFRDEICSFPGAPHDDQVDAFVYLITRFLTRSAAPIDRIETIQRPRGW